MEANAGPARGRGRSRRPRADWGTLSREQVVDAAALAVREGRSDRMTIRSLAAELGVAPMSLYRHVQDKDDLLDEVSDGLLSEVWKPRARRSNWRTWTVEAADRLRLLLVNEPIALRVYLRHPVVSPTAIVRMDAMLDVLKGAGFAEEEARRAFGAIHTYTIGFAALEASRGESVGERDNTDEVRAALAKLTTPAQFKIGLELILDGLRPTAKS
jgi:TetR/AcrR family transcriptional regulator, tetracycline repressor protein